MSSSFKRDAYYIYSIFCVSVAADVALTSAAAPDNDDDDTADTNDPQLVCNQVSGEICLPILRAELIETVQVDKRLVGL